MDMLPKDIIDTLMSTEILAPASFATYTTLLCIEKALMRNADLPTLVERLSKGPLT